jgi:hypothetical protein
VPGRLRLRRRATAGGVRGRGVDEPEEGVTTTLMTMMTRTMMTRSAMGPEMGTVSLIDCG